MSTHKIDVFHEENGTAGRYCATIEGREGEAELTWRKVTPEIIIADHTYAPDSLRGTGAADVMVQRLIADARARGVKIAPACSYVRAQFDRHPEWADLRVNF